MKALLLHVATDSTNPKEGRGTLGVVAPVFSNLQKKVPFRDFVYIPIADPVRSKPRLLVILFHEIPMENI